MPELTRQIAADIWSMAKSGQTHPDDGLARVQKFMVMHEDLHPHLERLGTPKEDDVAAQAAYHCTMDASTEASLEQGKPEGIRELMQTLLDTGMDPGQAFHVLSQAMEHTVTRAATAGAEWDPADYLALAKAYSAQAIAGLGGSQA